MDLNEVFDSGVGFVALAAVVGIVLLLPLYFSQRRDLLRLRAWREREPEYAGEDLARSEDALDSAETELEELLGEVPGREEAAAEPTATPTEPVTAAYRVTHERPALERITMERAALEPHPRWRRFIARVTQPRALIAIGAAALLLGAGAIFLSEELLSGDGDGAGAARGFTRAEITVSVLNGTSISGLADDVGFELESRGYKIDALTTTDPGVTKSVVMFAPGRKAAARKVAKDLDIDDVEPADRGSLRLAGKADVIVIAGEDRARQ